MKQVLAIIPFYNLPNAKDLKRESIEIAKSAYQLLIYGQKEESLRLAELAISLNSNDETIWAILTEIQIANQLFDEALISIKEGKRLNAEMSEFYFAESSIYLKQKKFRRAKTALLEGLQITPDNYNAIFQLGNIFLIEKNYRKAIIEFEKAILINPNFWQAINNKGLAFFELDKKLLAVNSFKEAIKINENAETLLALAASLENNNPEAILLAKKALTKDPQYVSYEYRKEQLWGEKLQNSTKELFLLEELENDIRFAKKYLN